MLSISDLDEETRVKIGYETGDTDNYINANRVELANSKGSNSLLIITQAPIEFTVPHFELMLRDYQIQCVLMLCNFV